MKWNRLYALRLLVGLSLVLLLGFLSFWNIENYRKEKSGLTQDLTNQMSLACSEYRDSVVKDIFRLVKIDGEARIETKVHRFPSRIQEREFNSETKKPLKVVERFKGKQALDYEIVTSFVEENDSFIKSEHFHTEGPDTFINITLDYPSELSPGEQILAWTSGKDSALNLEFANNLSADTTVIWGEFANHKFGKGNLIEGTSMPTLYNKIDSLFAQRLAKNNINLSYDKSKSLAEIDSTDQAIVIPFEYETLGFRSPPVVIFSNYQSYLFKKISPALLLSFLLFAIVAISFYVVMKSWAAQLRLTKLKNEFISNMTHELNTPIATIGVAIEALENFGAMEDPVKRAEYLDISKHEVNRLKILVDKVLKMSTLDKDYNKLTLTKLDFKELVENTIQSLRIHFEKFQVEVKTDFSAGNFFMKADKVHLTNVLHNLIDNAIKYSTDQPKINIALSSANDSIFFKISDQGIGIPKAYQHKIFDRFFRVPKEDTHNVKGHGLGLHYVQSIIQQHGGKINIDSKVDQGTTLIIEMPQGND